MVDAKYYHLKYTEQAVITKTVACFYEMHFDNQAFKFILRSMK